MADGLVADGLVATSVLVGSIADGSAAEAADGKGGRTGVLGDGKSADGESADEESVCWGWARSPALRRAFSQVCLMPTKAGESGARRVHCHRPTLAAAANRHRLNKKRDRFFFTGRADALSISCSGISAG